MGYFSKYAKYLYDKTFGRTRWGYVIFFVTNRCNARCRHCFYWKSLNQATKELSLDEIDRLTKKLGKTEVLLLSGGEPFLREDLAEIIGLFIKNCGVRVVSIPTNGILTAKILAMAEELLRKYPSVTFSINPSIDDLGDKHDKLRDCKGAFGHAIETLKGLEKLKSGHDNLDVVVSTTVSNENFKNLEEIMDFFKGFNLTYHNFELLRGEPKEKSIMLPDLKAIKAVHRKVMRLREYYILKNHGGLLERLSVLGILRYSQKIKEGVLAGKGLPFTCSAGKNIIVIEPEGTVRLCELLPQIGNLRDHEYDMDKLLNTKEAKRMYGKIPGCYCTHVCFINMSMAKDNKTLIKAPYSWLRWSISA